MSEIKEEKKSGWFIQTVHKIKTWLPAGLILFSVASVPHKSTANCIIPNKDRNETVQDNRLAELKKELQSCSFVTYKGIKLNLNTLKPQDVAHVFESAMNPCITDGNKPISQASYLGLCQMDFNNTLQGYVKNCQKDFPKLQQAVNKTGIRSQNFMNAWKSYSYGPQADKFEKSQFDYMWNIIYQKIFDNLTTIGNFPKITPENYADSENFLYTAAVISCANQNPKRTAAIFLQAKKQLGPKASLDNIALQTYNIKTIQWKKLTSRYKQEKKLLQDKQKHIKLTTLYIQLQLQNKSISFSAENPSTPEKRNLLTQKSTKRQINNPLFSQMLINKKTRLNG